MHGLSRLHTMMNFYPRPPRGGRQEIYAQGTAVDEISIHALREEGDLANDALFAKLKQFLSTPSARRATSQTWESRQYLTRFLSTPSARRATAAVPGIRKSLEHFYPRPPRGGRHDYGNNTAQIVEFLSTPSARRATTAVDEEVFGYQISIHALREEGDVKLT